MVGLLKVCARENIDKFKCIPMISKRTEPQGSSLATSALDEGLAKLETYCERLDVVPAYTLATILNPNAKL
ncbi:hypothetical protein IW262DRAFT_1451287 [Armillaria fumosa]|nr:hypothetical protein IW262DRAFT_1451287 [Armillaria fumosa]